MVHEEMYELLLRSFDQDLSPGDQEVLDKAIIRFPELEKEKKRLQQLRAKMITGKYAFKSGFASRVMKRVSDEQEPLILTPSFNRSLSSAFLRIAMTAVAAVIVLLLSIYLSEGSIDVNSLTGADTFSGSDDNLVSYMLYEDYNK